MTTLPEPAAPTPKPPALAAQVSHAVLWNTLFAPVRLLAEILSTLLKLWALVPAQYGFLSVFSAVNNGFGTAIDLGTGRALPKYIPETLRSGGPRAMRRLLTVVLGMQLAMLVLIAGGQVVFRGWYASSWATQINGSDAIEATVRGELLNYVGTHIWTLIAITVVLQLVSIFYDVGMAYLSSFFKQRAWNAVDITAQVLPKLLVIGVIAVGWGLPGLLFAMVAAPTIATCALLWTIMRHQREIAALPQPAEIGPRIPAGFMSYCAVSLLMNGSDFVASANFAIFFAGGLVNAGVLTAGVSIVRMVLATLYTPMVGLQVPLFTRVRGGEGGTINGAYQSVVRLQVLLLIPGGVGLLVLAQQVFASLLPEYSAAATLVWVLVPCLFVESMLSAAHNALIVYERLGSVVMSRVLALVAVPLVVMLSPVLGIVGVALAFGLARVAAGLWVTLRGGQLLGLRWPWHFTLRVLLASGMMAAVVGGLSILLPTLTLEATALDRLLQLPLLLGVAIVGALVLFGALRLTGGLDPADREQLMRLKLPGKRWIMRVL